MTTHGTALLLSAALGVTLTVTEETRWQSPTFTGSRLTLSAATPLPEIAEGFDLDIPGALIADITPSHAGLTVLLVDFA